MAVLLAQVVEGIAAGPLRWGPVHVTCDTDDGSGKDIVDNSDMNELPAAKATIAARGATESTCRAWARMAWGGEGERRGSVGMVSLRVGVRGRTFTHCKITQVIRSDERSLPGSLKRLTAVHALYALGYRTGVGEQIPRIQATVRYEKVPRTSPTPDAPGVLPRLVWGGTPPHRMRLNAGLADGMGRPRHPGGDLSRTWAHLKAAP
jgi:hypothetical protein